MKKKFSKILGVGLVLALLVSLLLMAAPVSAAKPAEDCVRIQDGILTYSDGHYLEEELLQVGFDPFGYNYQSHMFSGSYANSYLGKDGFPPYDGDAEAYLDENPDAANKWYWPYRDVQLMMKWSDIWLSNVDCNDDGLLDRGGPGGTNSAANGSWLTNHQRGINEGVNWTYYVKIVYPTDGDIPDGAEAIWGAYIVLQRVDSGMGATNYSQPTGFGAYK